MSYIASDVDISNPCYDHAWRAEGGNIHATVRLSDRLSTLFFDSAADARAVAAACTEAAEALDRLAAEATEASGG